MLMVSMTHEGMGRCLAVEDATTREVFEIYLEQTLCGANTKTRVTAGEDDGHGLPLLDHKGESE